MARKTDIRLRRSNTADAVPTSGNLSLGEMAMNTADGALYFKTSDNTVITAHDNTIMHIDSLNDRVGIGNSSPSAKLHVKGDISNNSVADYGLAAFENTNLEGLNIGYDADGNHSYLYSREVGVSSRGLRLNGSIYISSYDGNVGVGTGTNTLTNKLQVDGFAAIYDGLRLGSAGSGEGIFRHNPGTGNNGIGITTGSLNQGGIRLFVQHPTDGGGVGIGTTTPGEKLEVVGNVEAEEFIGDLRGALLFKAQAGEALSKGDVVYISGISGNTTVVSKADADDSAKMPAFGVAAAAANLNSAVDIYTFGTLSGIDTSSYSEGDELYVSTTAGEMTNSAPTGSGSLLQKIAKVTRSDASAGSIKVIGAGRTNAVPNLDQYKIFVGNSSNQAVQGNNALTVDIDNNAVGINTGDPDAYVSSLGARLHIATNAVLNSNNPLLYLRANGGSAMSEIRYQNSLKFTNGSAALHGFIDSSGRLTFGNATNFSDANADDFQIGNTSGAHGITIVAQNSHNASIYFADNDNNDAGRIAYNHTNNRMEFYTNRSQRMVITSAGNVGIGTNAAAEKLEVRDGTITSRDATNTNYAELDRFTGLTLKGNGAGTRGVQTPNADALTLGTNNTERVRISSGGNVGIGTTSPDTLLHLSNGGTTPATIRIERDDYSIEDTDVYGGIEFESQDNSAASAAGIRGKILGVAEGATGEMALVFETAGSYGSSTERLRINSVGQVGIGTNSPSIDAGVEITKAAPNTGITTLRLTNSVNNRGQRIDFVDDNAARAFTITHDNGGNTALIGTIISEPLLFVTNNTERVRILSGGNVGIGESVPTEKLHVAGNIKMQASATVLTFQNNSNTWNVGCDAGDASFKFKDGTDERIRILSDGNTIFGGTSVGAAGAMSVKVDGTYTDLYLYGAGTSQGGRIFFGDSSDRSSITGTYGTGGGGKLSFKTDTTGGTSQDRLVIDSDGSIRFNNAFTFPTSIGSSGQVLKVPSTGSTLVWADDAGGGSATVLTDTDGDTKIQVEESADEDVIRFDVAGTEQMQLNSTGLTVAGNLTVNGTQTVLNTSTLTVDDLSITVADGAANAQAADGAGINVAGAAANISYQYSNDRWTLNKEVFTPAGFMIGTTATDVGLIKNSSGVFDFQAQSAREISFSNVTNGEHMRIDADGKVGIGTTDPQDLLHLSADSPVLRLTNTSDSGKSSIEFWDNQSGTSQSGEVFYDDSGNLFGLQGNANGIVFKASNTFPSSELMRLTGNGRLGIGTNSPGAQLHVDDSTGIIINDSGTASQTQTQFLPINSAGNSQLKVKGGNYVHTVAYETSWNDFEYARLVSSYNTSDSRFDLNKSASDGTTAATTRISTGTSYFNGDVGVGTTSPASNLHIKTSVDNSVAQGLIIERSANSDRGYINYNGGGFQFRSTVGDPIVFGETDAEHVRIQPDGNVGIGTSSPSDKLHLNGAANATTGVTIGNNNSTRLRLYHDDNAGASLLSTDAVGTEQQLRIRSGSFLALDTGGTSERVRITADGDVGIGTTSPSKTLDVNGSMKAFAFEASGSGNKVITIGSSNDGTYYNGLIVWNQYNTSQPAHRLTASSGGGSHYEYGRGKLSFIENQGSDITRMVIKQGNVGIGNDSPVAKLQVEEYGVDTSSTTTTATTQVAIHTFPIADFRTARFTIQITNTTDSTYHSTEIIAVHDGTTANITEFGEVHTGTSVEATFDADISSNNFRLLATPASTDSMTFKVVCHSITV